MCIRVCICSYLCVRTCKYAHTKYICTCAHLHVQCTCIILSLLIFSLQIEQFQADFNQERKDREGAAGTFADREMEWMEEIRRTGEERDHLKALMTQLQDQTNHQKLEVSLHFCTFIMSTQIW